MAHAEIRADHTSFTTKLAEAHQTLDRKSVV